MLLRLVSSTKGGKGSGWFSPPQGTHTGERHRQSGSGRAKVRLESRGVAGIHAVKRGAGATKDEILEYFSQHGTVDSFLDDVIPGATDAIAESLEGVPLKHLDGLNEITIEPPTGYGYSDKYYTRGGSTRVTGVYDPLSSVIHLHPNTIARGGSTAVHELGHHITKRSLGWRRDMGMLAKASRDVSRTELADMGLRPYSRTSGDEWLADAYMVWNKGTNQQWANLNGYVVGALGESHDLERLFGER